ncbi:MAG: nitroreductase family protein [Acidobacteria bacterium]|jgi:nitroreductase|nr:nitroreductase family protein [Acidobacteriota bacterium]
METGKLSEAKRAGLGAIALILVLSSGLLPAGELQAIKLNPPDLKRGLPLMAALAARASARDYSEKDLSLQDLSDLLWAADGMSRPAENKSTAPSAMNSHDIRIYVFMKDGAYLYDPPRHELLPLLAGDFRSQIMMARPPRPAIPAAGVPAAPPAAAPAAPPVPPAPPAASPPPPSAPPVEIVLVSDGDRFTRGDPERKFEWGAIDAGIVSQNISLFCAATGLKTRPKASMDKARIKELLKLTAAQVVFLNHPVGYAK